MVALLLVGGPGAAGARAADVLIVLTSDAGPYREAGGACAAKLKALGHVSRTLLLADVTPKALEESAAVIALGTGAAAALHQAEAPASRGLFYAMVAQPAEAGLTSGRAALGVSTDAPLAAQVKLIGDTLPAARRVGALYRKSDEGSRARIERLRAALPAGWTLAAVAVEAHESAGDAIDALLSERPDVVWTEADAAIYNGATVRTLLLAGLRRGTPVFGFSGAFVKAGALVGVVIEAPAQGEQIAELAHAALSGGTPAPTSGGVVEPRFGVAVNLIVARTLNVTVPEAVRRGAAVVYEQEEKR